MIKTTYFRYSLAVLLLTNVSTVRAQSPGSLSFDLSRVPFSRFGSYLMLTTADRDKNGKADLNLFDQTGNVIWGNSRVMRIEPFSGGQVPPVSYRATPEEVTSQAGDGRISCYYENARILHLCATGTDIRLTADGKFSVYPVPGHPETYILHNKYLVLSARAGHIRLVDDGNILLEKNSAGQLDIVVEQYFGDWVPHSYTETREQSLAKLDREFSAWEQKMPAVPAKYEPARRLAAYMTWSCMWAPRENIKRYGMAMSKNWMSYIWSWDHCFNALGLSYGQPALSWDQFMVIFDHQSPETGALPDLISSENILWESKKPPIHGWILSELLKHYPMPSGELPIVYTKLCKWTNYWLISRDEDRNGLPQYYSGFDSGWDNGTAFDMGGPAEGPDLAAFLILQMDELAKLADQLHRPAEAAAWRKKSAALLDKLCKELWNGERFITRKTDTHEINPESRNLMSYYPLLLGKKLPLAIRNKMIADLEKEGFMLTPYGFASESPQSKLYEADGYWRGPVWGPNMVIVLTGLRNCGEERLARLAATRYCNLCLKSGFSENYNALTGAPLRDPAYTWAASAFLVLAHDYLLPYEKK
jgi:putative isomerase